ncbi:CBS domain-containing protein [Nesterenkonia sp. CF4.4]|uniref:CBS domain-containing protein n=1 Tax=Nesterenkonia sp. CF4.4 TaxID=3373079 RepID=UPI003EE6A1E8
MTTVREIMGPVASSVEAHWTLQEVDRAMREAGVDFWPLCDAAGKFHGVVAQHDIVQAVRSLEALAQNLTAKHLVHTNAPTIGMNDSIEKAMADMAIHQSQYLAVWDGTTVTGVISSADIQCAAPVVQTDQFFDHVGFPPIECESQR